MTSEQMQQKINEMFGGGSGGTDLGPGGWADI